MYYILHIPTNQFIYTIDGFDPLTVVFTQYELEFSNSLSKFKLLSVRGQSDFEQLFSYGDAVGYNLDFSDTYSVQVSSDRLHEFCLIPIGNSHEILC